MNNHDKMGYKNYAFLAATLLFHTCFFTHNINQGWANLFTFSQLFNTPVWKPNAVVVRELFRSLRLISIAFV